MSDYQANSTVRFDKEQSLDVRQTPEQVTDAINACTTKHVPLVELTSAHGAPVQVNAAQIRYVEAPRRGASFT